MKKRTPLALPGEIVEILRGYRTRAIWHSQVADVYACKNPQGTSAYYLKRHKKISSHDSVKERDVINWLQGRLPVPRVRSFAADGKYYYTLLTVLPGITAFKLIKQMKPQEMITVLVKGMKKLHSVPITDCPFDESVDAKLKRIRYNIDQGFIRKDIYNKRSQRNAESDLKYLQENKPAKEDLVLTHGDFCLPNFLIEDGVVTGFLDLGDIGISDRYLDISTLAWTIGYNYNSFESFFHYWRLIFREYGIDKPDWSKLQYYQLMNDML